jgi:hypothetical protein
MLARPGEVADSKLFHHAQHLQYANAFGQAGSMPAPARPLRAQQGGKARSQEAARFG